MKNNNVVMFARRCIVWTGKYAPFIIVAIVTLSNLEALYSLVFGIYADYNGAIVYYKPISWFIGDYFKISLLWVVVLFVFSIGVEACVWNRICIIYLCSVLWQKDYFLEHTIDETMFGIVLSLNCMISVLLVLKGINILIKYN